MKKAEEEKEVNTEIAVSEHQQMVKSSAGLQLSTIKDMLEFSEYVAKSPFCPKGMEKPGDVLVCLQSGAEIGLPPMTALQSIAVINGRPGIWGDAALALVRASGLLEIYKDEMIDDKDLGDERGCKVTVKRKDFDIATEIFTIADAKRANLWEKKSKTGVPSTWCLYPKRMLMFKARGYILRDQFGDVLKGFKTVEELRDYDEDIINIETKPGGLIDSVSDHLDGKPDQPKKDEPKKEKQSEPSPEGKAEHMARVNWNNLTEICAQDKISYPRLKEWAKKEGRNMDIETEAGAAQVIGLWSSIKDMFGQKKA